MSYQAADLQRDSEWFTKGKSFIQTVKFSTEIKSERCIDCLIIILNASQPDKLVLNFCISICSDMCSTETWN